MKAENAMKLAVHLMEQHGLSEKKWKFRFNNLMGSVGRAINDKGRKFIELSLPYVKVNTENYIREAILHEIAHAKRGIRHKHDSKWRLIARSIGASGMEFLDMCLSRPGGAIIRPKGIGRWICRACGWSIEIYRRPRPRVRYSCRKCLHKHGDTRTNNLHFLMRREYYGKPHSTWK